MKKLRFKKGIGIISILLIASSIFTVSYVIPIFENNSEVRCLNISPSKIESGHIQIDMIFSPFTANLKLTAVECSPAMDDLQFFNNRTGDNPFDDWFNATLLLDIYGDFISGTGYQFVFRFIDEYGLRKVVRMYEPYSLDSESNSEGPSINTSIPTNQNPEEVGNQIIFWTPSLEGYVQTLGTLLAIGTTCYVYMANSSIDLLGEENSISKSEALQEVFDEVIYPKGVELAGNPDGILGDIDNDPKITVYLCPMVRTMGQAYLGTHRPRDELPGSISNEREMIFVDSEKDLNETICITNHELNHLIWHNYELDEADFLLEGLANYANDYAGYWWYITDAVTRSFTSHPEVSLLHFNRFYGRYWDASYGQAYLFVTYLAERFGVDFVRNLVGIEQDAALGIEEALDEMSSSMSFNDVFLDWITACVLDDTSLEDGRYGFATQNYTIQSKTRLIGDLPVNREAVRHNLYGFDVKQVFSPDTNFTFEIENPYPNALGIVVAIHDEDGWTVTQSLHHSVTGTFSEYIEGRDIQEVYIITSVMKPDAPVEYYDVFSLDEIPHVLLDYSFMDGIVQNYSQVPFFITIFVGLPVISFVSIVAINKYRRNALHSHICKLFTARRRWRCLG